MDCEVFNKIVLDILFDEGDARQSAEARRHIEQCDRCAKWFGSIQRVRTETSDTLKEAPFGFETELLQAARRFQRSVPLPRRFGRWVSWAGAYAMRPQISMAVLLLLMIGSSLFLIQGRRRGNQVDVVRVTEQGVPDRDGAETSASRGPSLILPTDEASIGNRSRVASVDFGTPASEGGRPKSTTTAPDSPTTDGQAGMLPSAAESSTGSTVSQRGAVSDESSGAAKDAFADAVAMYKSGNYVGAYRAFDAIAQSGGSNAPSASMYAAKSVRASSGCAHALPRFDFVATRYAGTAAGLEARWETAACARITGDLTRARIIYRDLARDESQRERAETELARISNAPSPTPSGSYRNDNSDKSSDHSAKHDKPEE